MITPIRGRKLFFDLALVYYNLIRNDNPDKGTETVSLISLMHGCLLLIRNDNPDKGTETLPAPFILVLTTLIRNDNPDKGTETSARR